MNHLGANPLVSYIIATYNRPDPLEEAIDSVLEQTYRPLEIVIVDNSSTKNLELFEEGGRFDEEFIHYYYITDQMSISAARNFGFERASGPIIVQIDDDATLGHPDVTEEVVSIFRKHASVGALAFKSLDSRTGELRRIEVPDPPDFRTPPSKQYRTTSFIGVGVAFRKTALEKAGGYPEDFKYGFEEMDLSVRLLDCGYDILYNPSLVVFHKKSPEGRKSEIEMLESQVENRIKIAIRNLPWRYVLFTALIWFGYLILVTRSVSSLLKISRRIYRDQNLTKRDIIDRRTIALIKSRNSMLYCWWYGPNPRRILNNPGRLKW